MISSDHKLIIGDNYADYLAQKSTNVKNILFFRNRYYFF